MKIMLNNEAKLLNEALCIVCPQRQRILIVCHDMANMIFSLTMFGTMTHMICKIKYRIKK